MAGQTSASLNTPLHEKDSLGMLSPVSRITVNAQGEVSLDFDPPMPAVSFV
jgi:hypothetical protein